MIVEAGYAALAARIEGSGKLWSASIEVTRGCNERCVHCLRVPGEVGGPTLAELRDWLDQLAGLGCLKITFTGGEPFTRPDFLDVLRAARAADMAAVVLTNATLVTERTARFLADLPVLDVQVSLYAVDPAVHDAITALPGSHARTLAGLDRLRAAGVPVRVSTPLMAANASEVPAVRALCAAWGVPWRWSGVLFPRDDGDPAPLRQVATDGALGAVVPLLVAGEGASPPRASAGGLCGAGVNRLEIDAGGLVYPCSALRRPVGDLRRERLADIWSGSAELAGLRRLRPEFPSACAGCAARDHCFWCPGLSLATVGRLTVPNPQDCRRTRYSFGGSCDI